MKKFLSYLVLSICSIISIGQIISKPDEMEPSVSYDNVHVQKIAGDSLSSTFLIWIKKEVKPHFHQSHSEVIIVMQGKGVMLLNKETLKLKKGDLVFIPKGTVHSVTTTSRKPLKVISIQSPHFDGSDRVLIGESVY